MKKCPFLWLYLLQKKRDEDILQKSTRTALKDARQTVYVNGRWILANDHVTYRILRSTLPTDGDYLAYFKDFQQKDGKLKDESHQLDDIDRQFQNQTANANISNSLLWSSSSAIPSSSFSPMSTASNQLMDKQTILSGLTYTVQFVNLIAFYLVRYARLVRNSQQQSLRKFVQSS